MTTFKRLLVLVPLLLFLVPSSASATTPAPGWTISSLAEPTNFEVGHSGTYTVTVTNAGSIATNGSEIKVEDELPAGLTVQGVEMSGASCESSPVECSFTGTLEPDGSLQMRVNVSIEPGGPKYLTNRATVSGGGTAETSVAESNDVASSPASFGPSNFSLGINDSDGAPDTQAGDHPYELVTTIGLDNAARATGPEGIPADTSVQDLKDVVVDLPVGFVGSTLAAPECTLAQLSSEKNCPGDTIVGHIRTEPESSSSVDSPIYNLVPERGVPAEFGYVDVLHGAHVFYVHVVPTPDGYVLQTTNADIPAITLRRVSVTFYGDPAARDAGIVCGSGSEAKEVACRAALANAQVPFFTNPTGCENGPLKTTIFMDSWQNPARFNADGTPVSLDEPQWAKMESVAPPVTGCNALSFTPELVSKPTTEEADTPSGMELEMKFPQTEDVNVSATPELRNATVTFPAGFTLDPSSGDGLQACSEAQIGWLGGTPKNFSPQAPECPEASKVGSLEVTTPLIPRKLTGEMYLANQNENPYGSVIGLYVVVQDPITGVLVKIAGKTVTNPQTGQITGIFEENPQLPINELKLGFSGGPRAEFATSDNCGSFQTTSSLEPWSLEGSELPATPFASFAIDTGCVSGFNPAFTGSDTNVQAGAYSAFVTSFSREDTDQELGGLSLSLPPGLAANLSSVPLCGEAQANTGTCPESSQIGTVLAEAGPGPNPLPDTGRAYLTGPYNGGAFGMSVVIPAIAGPFNFGDVVVRQSIRIDPLTARVTVVSNPFPTILNPKTTNSKGEVEEDGIPIRLRRVQVTIERPNGAGFTFNPTNCSKLHVGGTITSTQGEAKALETPFQVTNCASLGFTPKLSASISAQSSKADGTGLTVKLAYPSAPFGSQANISRVKVDLPKQLPSRLTTLQQACTAAQFNSNPAGCPSGSIVGHAVVHTPILSAPLEGPAYFVSHGGEEFPNLTIVLQGDGVTVKLVGDTFIDNKTGVTSSTFNTVPDVPVETFELTLPTGPYSALAADLPTKANYNFCGQTLAMPTAFYAQNGAEIHDSTSIAINGCKKAKQTRAQKLAAALKACHRKPKHKRAQCAATARKHYGAAKKPTSKGARKAT